MRALRGCRFVEGSQCGMREQLCDGKRSARSMVVGILSRLRRCDWQGACVAVKLVRFHPSFHPAYSVKPLSDKADEATVATRVWHLSTFLFAVFPCCRASPEEEILMRPIRTSARRKSPEKRDSDRSTACPHDAMSISFALCALAASNTSVVAGGCRVGVGVSWWTWTSLLKTDE